MSLFIDQLLVQLSDPAQLIELLAPATDTNHDRLITLLKAVYDFQFATIQGVVGDPKVLQVEPERLLLTTHRTQGTWTQTIPSYGRTDVIYEGSDRLEPIWLDIAAQVNLTLLLKVDLGEVDTVIVHSIDHFQTLDEFRARFSFIDLQAFMDEHGLKTVEELREHAQYLRAEIRLKQLGTEAKPYSYSLSIAVFIRDGIDIAATLHDIKLARAVSERVLAYGREFNGNEVLAPYAPIVIFPRAALNGDPFREDALQPFFANQGVLALFWPLS